MPDEMPDIIVVDDDPMVSNLSHDLLTDEGYKVCIVQDSMEAIETIRGKKPRLVIMDIMMPGISGMELCKRLKSDPELKKTKVVLVSGKSFQAEKQQARELGCDFFIQKPYSVDSFAKTIKQILDGVPFAATPPPPPPPPPPQKVAENPTESSDLKSQMMRVTIWGCRGFSMLIPNTASRYGRQTSCVSVEIQNHLFILDAGTGMIELGRDIIQKGRHRQLWNVLTHFHVDHIMGLGEFAPAHKTGYAIRIIGANDPEKNLRDMIQQVFHGPSAWTEQPPKAEIDLYEILEDTYELVPGLKLSTMYSNHPTTTLCIGLESSGKKIVYAPASEIFGEATSMQDYDEKLAYFCKDADVLIHDAHYDDKEYESHHNEGHSCASTVLEFAAEKAGVKELVLFHLNPCASDEALDAMHEHCVKMARDNSWPIKCTIAKEGYVIDI